MTADPGPDLPPLRDVIARHGLSAAKTLGQNFLLDEQLLDRIAAVPGALAGEHVLEVGPGPGGLTRALLRAGAIVYVVEKDSRCVPALTELAAHFPGRLHIVEGDATVIDPAQLIGAPYHVVANLPYNVGTALLVSWTSQAQWPPQWKSLTLMFQREVADRIIAPPGSNHYGRLAVLVQSRCDARLAMRVHRSAFTPAPKVMSAVVQVTPRPADKDIPIAALERLTAAAFGQRRKMLRQSLKALPGAVAALDRIGVDPALRAEKLDIARFVALAREIEQGAA